MASSSPYGGVRSHDLAPSQPYGVKGHGVAQPQPGCVERNEHNLTPQREEEWKGDVAWPKPAVQGEGAWPGPGGGKGYCLAQPGHKQVAWKEEVSWPSLDLAHGA